MMNRNFNFQVFVSFKNKSVALNDHKTNKFFLISDYECQYIAFQLISLNCNRNVGRITGRSTFLKIRVGFGLFKVKYFFKKQINKNL